MVVNVPIGAAGIVAGRTFVGLGMKTASAEMNGLFCIGGGRNVGKPDVFFTPPPPGKVVRWCSARAWCGFGILKMLADVFFKGFRNGLAFPNSGCWTWGGRTDGIWFDGIGSCACLTFREPDNVAIPA